MFDQVPERWRRASPLQVDGVLAGLLVTLAVSELVWGRGPSPEVRPVTVAIAVGLTAPIAWRRLRPDLVMAVVGCVAIGATVLAINMPFGGAFGLLVALYSVAAHGPERDANLSGLITLVVLVYVGIRYWGDAGIGGAAANLLLFASAWVLGYAARNRRLLVEQLEERATEAERSRQAAARQAVTDERTRIARELHDVVAHAVGVMVVQAGAARRLIERERAPDAADAVRAIETTGRGALSELRRLLGVLRTDAAGSTGLAPQPSVAAVDELVATFRRAGLPIHLESGGDVSDLPAGIDVSVYRVVQEALTNVLKHAGPVRRVDVQLRRDRDGLAVSVTDDGQGAAAADRGSGHGLLGMRERVTLYGGRLHAGPRPGGGFRVQARVPLLDSQVLTEKATP